ncbi:MAG: HAD-IIIC family phosphatase [Nitrospirota bacterium]
MKNQIDFKALKKNLNKDFNNFKSIKIAVLGDSATQLLVQAIKGYGYENKLRFDCFEAEFDQIERQILDYSSDLYKFSPEYVFIFHSTQKSINQFYSLAEEQKERFSEERISYVRQLCDALNSRLSCKIVLSNLPEVDDNVFGNYFNKIKVSAGYQQREYNYKLMNICQEYNNLFINDINMLQSRYGLSFVFDPKIYVTSSMVYSIDFLPVLAKNSVDIINATSGIFKKCIVLDLDNTLWGGIIGDDGIDNIQIGDLGIGKAYTEFQKWLKQLKRRGIILAVCSKNTENIAKEPFEKHPDMVLRLDDIAVFVANWNTKVDNIRYIQSVLNIGYDSIVFCDDNPVEREIVRTYIPEVTVPELPEDPAEYIVYLRSLNLFETATYSHEDTNRTKLYQQEARRRDVQAEFKNEDDFLKSLAMVSDANAFNSFTIPRIAQLTQRSNQFNLRTVRYTEEEIKKISESPDFITRSYTLEDKFGDYGLISVLILKVEGRSLFLDTWIMSCRVLKRNMEYFVLNDMVDLAEKNGYDTIIGEYLPTAKNDLVKEHYKDLGFKPENGMWKLEINSYNKKPNYIRKKE